MVFNNIADKISPIDKKALKSFLRHFYHLDDNFLIRAIKTQI